MTNFEKLYNEVIKKSLVEKFGYKNPHEIPKLTKIVLNMGVGEAVTDKKKLNNAVDEMALIAGQKPVVTKARKSIATFKLREEMPIGCKVTLRSDRMYEFLERLVNMALPRIIRKGPVVIKATGPLFICFPITAANVSKPIAPQNRLFSPIMQPGHRPFHNHC